MTDGHEQTPAEAAELEMIRALTEVLENVAYARGRIHAGDADLVRLFQRLPQPQALIADLTRPRIEALRERLKWAIDDHREAVEQLQELMVQPLRQMGEQLANAAAQVATLLEVTDTEGTTRS